jgi:uncharacterized membrane protein
MYKINSGFRWTTTADTEREIFALALAPEDIDSDLQQLEEHRLNNVGQLNHNCEMDSNQKLTKTQSEQELEYLLSNLLKYGVLIASAVVLFGGILYLLNHGSEPAEYQFFRGTPSEFHSPGGIVTAVLSGSRRGIIQLGLLLLIATPILRVIVSLFSFLIRREFIYVIITSIVLASLTYSLVGAYY